MSITNTECPGQIGDVADDGVTGEECRAIYERAMEGFDQMVGTYSDLQAERDRRVAVAVARTDREECRLSKIQKNESSRKEPASTDNTHIMTAPENLGLDGKNNSSPSNYPRKEAIHGRVQQSHRSG